MSSASYAEPRRATRIVGIDIGGANLKLANISGESLSIAFPMWKSAKHLHRTVAAALTELGFGDARHDLDFLAVTITGEMADCFLTRSEGIESILGELAINVPPDLIKVYSVNGDWLSPVEAKADPWSVASSNWHALGTWIAQDTTVRGETPTLLVDIGSTTTDVIPLCPSGVATKAKTDRDRLQLSQLVYTGVERTPVAAILHALKIEHSACPVMAERFADSLDAYLCLGAGEEPENLDTADGRPRTRRFARARLARMIGEDESTLSANAIDNLAMQIVDAQTQQILHAIHRNLTSEPMPKVLFSGHGGLLTMRIQDALRTQQIKSDSLDRLLPQEASRCAPALAVARLLKLHLADASSR